MSALSLDKFFIHQLSHWRSCVERYEELRSLKKRIITIDGRDYRLIHNPLRAKSVTARVENGKVERPCFLCKENRPEEQEFINITIDRSKNSYQLAVNPYPILSNHFTIISSQHSRQTITPERLQDMATIVRQMEGYLLFFNGALSGASAPDHFHFQAVRKVDVPLIKWDTKALETLFVQTCEAEEVKIDFDKSDATNILCWEEGGKLHWIVVHRHQHRPKEYYAEGAEKVLISPAALEYAGVVPLVRQEDFDKMTPESLAGIFHQCYDAEPLVDIGICTDEVKITPNSDGTTTIEGVPIGKNFHWEQKKAFTYEGKMFLCTDKMAGTWIVNRLKAERYLESVICSEMSQKASLNLLKAHAVISRSWLVRHVNNGKVHLLFDVCADDHCQRYQGIALGTDPKVAQAIAETRGEVLMYDGRVADTRYSKCCGGKTEEYRYCWEELDMPYLSSVDDKRRDGTVFCNTKDKEILRQVLNDYDQATTDFYEWQVVYTQEELSEIVEQKGGYGLGEIIAIEAVERGKSGRISRLKIIGEKGEVTIGKELEIRRMLSRTHLYSSNFNVVTSQDEASATIFTLKGRGWGHGVGLCQIGAAVMGAEGYDYKEILAHYYKNTEIKKIW